MTVGGAPPVADPGTDRPGRAGPAPEPANETPRPPLVTLRRVARAAAPPRGPLVLSGTLGAAAGLATVGLLACAGALIDRAALRPPLYTLTVLMAAVQILALCRGPLRYAERIAGHRVSFQVLANLRRWLFDLLEPLAPAGLRSWRSGDLLARAVGDADTLQDLYLRGISPLVVTCVVAAGAVTVTAVLAPAAGLVLAATLVVALAGQPLLLLRAGRSDARREASARGTTVADVVELLQGMPDLLAFDRAGEYLDRALAADDERTALARRRAARAGGAAALVSLCAGLAVVGVLATGALAVRDHALPAVMVGVLPLVALGAYDVVPSVGDAALRLSDHLAAASRLAEVADLPVPVADPEHPLPTPGGQDLEVHDAHLRYGPDLRPALRGLSLSLPGGSRTAVVGPSGAGKTSLVHALLRFWPLEGGSITLGGRPTDRLRQDDVRAAVALVAQDAHLFDTTIRANVLLGAPDADPARLEAALRAAQLLPWVAALPDGLDTRIGERGVSVSGGQRQRIAVARALLAETPVLVLDEPTAALDGPTAERLLQDVLDAVGERSLVLVTHRGELLDRFDEVVRVDAGRVDASGVDASGVATTPP